MSTPQPQRPLKRSRQSIFGRRCNPVDSKSPDIRMSIHLYVLKLNGPPSMSASDSVQATAASAIRARGDLSPDIPAHSFATMGTDQSDPLVRAGVQAANFSTCVVFSKARTSRILNCKRRCGMCGAKRVNVSKRGTWKEGWQPTWERCAVAALIGNRTSKRKRLKQASPVRGGQRCHVRRLSAPPQCGQI